MQRLAIISMRDDIAGDDAMGAKTLVVFPDWGDAIRLAALSSVLLCATSAL